MGSDEGVGSIIPGSGQAPRMPPGAPPDMGATGISRQAGGRKNLYLNETLPPLAPTCPHLPHLPLLPHLLPCPPASLHPLPPALI